MEERFLIDTNIIIYYLSGKIPDSHLNKINQILEKSFNISTITKVEILGWHKIPNAEKLKIESFIKQANVIYIDEFIEDKAISVKQKYKTAIPDAIIGATALVNNYTIVTRNVSDFKKIKNLNVYNPFES